MGPFGEGVVSTIGLFDKPDCSGSCGAVKLASLSGFPILLADGEGQRLTPSAVNYAADGGVIVGSAFIKALLDAPDEATGLEAVKNLASELSLGVREGR